MNLCLKCVCPVNKVRSSKQVKQLEKNNNTNKNSSGPIN